MVPLGVSCVPVCPICVGTRGGGIATALTPAVWLSRTATHVSLVVCAPPLSTTLHTRVTPSMPAVAKKQPLSSTEPKDCEAPPPAPLTAWS